MTDSPQRRAAILRELHTDGILVLPNAWDAGSAALIASAGAKVIATTSAAVSWALGRPDGEGLTRADMVAAVARIVGAVDVPVTADIEGGYGPSADDVAASVEAIIGAGAVGANIEDSLAPGGPLHTPAEQGQRLRAARSAAERAGLPEFVINARTDVYLFQIGAEEGRLDDVVARAEIYAESGADCLFVPGLVDLDVLTVLVARSPLPINVMAGPGAPEIAAFEAVGVRRVSVGSGVGQAAYSVARRVADELLTKGTYAALEDAEPFGTLNGAFARS
ncbi:isocitrate lyase/PEP mutase family protein [Pseudonocardia spinosispora]|uniref:isocitrate lyase/PEP mutase family protein n=1 Tax=Pseudonocardia spinosispora TaxID=103441 RepID=UPI000423373B|nr:isocitrate lyase/phosphoenolpyruvate mutase family protein [Pseudonocardia spinosispora]